MFSKYQAQMRQFQEVFTEQRDAAVPKKKFAFVRKARKAPAAAATSSANTDAAASSTSMSASANATAATDGSTSATATLVNTGNHLLIKDVSGDQNIIKTASEYEGKENVIVENLTDCTVILPFSIKCMYMKNLVNTRIYVGSVSGASFVNEAIDCKIHLQSH